MTTPSDFNPRDLDPRDLNQRAPDPLAFARFTELLAAYGADPARWPEAERAAALALLAASGEARARQSEAAAFDAALALPVAPPPARLRAQILRGQDRAFAPRPGLRAGLHAFWQELGGWRLAGPAFAASLALGIALGTQFDLSTTTASESEDLLEIAQLDTDRYAEYAP